MPWPFWVGFRGLSWRVPGCAHQAGTAALCKETACGSLPRTRAMQGLALAAVGLRAHPRAPGAAPLQEGLHWGVSGQQPCLSCVSVTSCTCPPFSSQPGCRGCCGPEHFRMLFAVSLLSVHLSFVFFRVPQS